MIDKKYYVLLEYIDAKIGQLAYDLNRFSGSTIN